MGSKTVRHNLVTEHYHQLGQDDFISRFSTDYICRDETLFPNKITCWGLGWTSVLVKHCLSYYSCHNWNWAPHGGPWTSLWWASLLPSLPLPPPHNYSTIPPCLCEKHILLWDVYPGYFFSLSLAIKDRNFQSRFKTPMANLAMYHLWECGGFGLCLFS